MNLIEAKKAAYLTEQPVILEVPTPWRCTDQGVVKCEYIWMPLDVWESQTLELQAVGIELNCFYDAMVEEWVTQEELDGVYNAPAPEPDAPARPWEWKGLGEVSPADEGIAAARRDAAFFRTVEKATEEAARQNRIDELAAKSPNDFDPACEVEFPGFVLDVAIPDGFDDVSCHMDDAPSFYNAALQLRLWVQPLGWAHPLKTDDRNLGKLQRFRLVLGAIEATSDTELRTLIEANDFSLVLGVIEAAEVLAKGGK